MDSNILEPVMRTDDHHKEKHASILNLIKNKKIDLLFLGDSITRRWEDNSELWDKYFKEFNPANLGVGGDATQNLKWRILNGEIDNISPKLAVLLIGTNNLPDYNEKEITKAIIDIINIIHDKLKNSKIILLGLLPRNIDEKKIDYMKMIKYINKELKKLAKNKYIIFYDIGKKYFTKNGKAMTNLIPDGLHPEKKGYEVFGKHLLKIIKRNWKK